MYHDETNDSPVVLHCRAQDTRDWAHPETGEVSIFPRYNWMNDIVTIAAANREAQTITLSRPVRTSGTAAIRPYDRYYVRNLFEELDAPGEWFLDSRTWTLYFWPPAPLTAGSVRAPVTENLIRIEAKAAWITVRGFTLTGCEGSAVSLNGADDCLIAGNTVHDTGGRLGPAAISVSGGHRCGAVGNDVFDVCNIGISLSGGDTRTLVPGNHYADNNYVHHVGILYGHGLGICISGVGQRVSHNLIHDITRCGVFGGGPDCIVEYNRIRNVNLETEDTGGRYGGGMWHIRGEIIRYNFVTDTLGFGRHDDRWTSPFFSWGIYLDDDQSYTQVYGNIAARTTSGGCHIHAGRNNTVFNNIFVDSSGPQIQYSGHDPKSPLVVGRLKEFDAVLKNPAYLAKYPDLASTDTNTVWHMAENRTLRNVVYYTDPKARLYGISQVAADPFEQNTVNSNLIWHGGQALKIDRNGKSLTWDEWRKAGYDADSAVADPLFVDPAHDDYRLKPGSPAFKLGFEAIPVDQIGPYRSALRASWPVVEVPGVREHPMPKARVLLWPDTAPNGDGTRELTDASMTVFLPPKELATGAAIVICPGGGYGRKVLTHEGTFIAQWLNEHGIAGVVLDYRLPHGRHAVPLSDAQRAIRLIRANAEAWNLQTNRVGIMGFSAGGHLAATAGTHFDAGDPKAKDAVERQSCRPDFMALVYPVIRMGENGNKGTQLNLLGANPAPDLTARYSNERQVTAQTPPAFLAHAQDDKVVPPSNSADFRDALKAHGVAVEYLALPSGGHGLNGYKGPMWEAWQGGLIDWLREQGFSCVKPPPGSHTHCGDCH
jgi:parallel beta-helix repeat protein